jgi:hypothetical protein
VEEKHQDQKDLDLRLGKMLEEIEMKHHLLHILAEIK